ncbi:unnamed protein product, partial [Allacma fusca]
MGPFTATTSRKALGKKSWGSVKTSKRIGETICYIVNSTQFKELIETCDSAINVKSRQAMTNKLE